MSEIVITLTMTWQFLFAQPISPWLWSDPFPDKASCEAAKVQVLTLGYRVTDCELRRVGP